MVLKKLQEDLIVDEYTSPAPYCANEDTPISVIMEKMQDEGIRHVPVINRESQAIGIISERDINVLVGISQVDNVVASQVMTTQPYCVYGNTALHDVVFKMSQEKIGSAIVIDEKDQVSGIFTSTDALNALIEVLRGEV